MNIYFDHFIEIIYNFSIYMSEISPLIHTLQKISWITISFVCLKF